MYQYTPGYGTFRNPIPTVEKLIVIGENFFNPASRHHHHRGQIREGKPQFVLEPEAHVYGLCKPLWGDPLPLPARRDLHAGIDPEPIKPFECPIFRAAEKVTLAVILILLE